MRHTFSVTCFFATVLAASVGQAASGFHLFTGAAEKVFNASPGNTVMVPGYCEGTGDVPCYTETEHKWLAGLPETPISVPPRTTADSPSNGKFDCVTNKSREFYSCSYVDPDAVNAGNDKVQILKVADPRGYLANTVKVLSGGGTVWSAVQPEIHNTVTIECSNGQTCTLTTVLNYNP